MKKNFVAFLLVALSLSFVFLNSCKKKSEEIPHPYTIGQHFGGGIIFYIDASWNHGLICASSDQGESYWGSDQLLIGGTSAAIGTGQANTNRILNHTPSADPAFICDNYSVTVGEVTYSDWFLPSIDELNQIYTAKILTPSYTVGYWSSTEENALDMRTTNNGGSTPLVSAKSYGYCHVMPIRAF